jgi:hypothetical protein
VVGVPVDLEPGDLLAAGAGDDGEDLVLLVEHAQHGVVDDAGTPPDSGTRILVRDGRWRDP